MTCFCLAAADFLPGQEWADTDGDLIQVNNLLPMHTLHTHAC